MVSVVDQTQPGAATGGPTGAPTGGGAPVGHPPPPPTAEEARLNQECDALRAQLTAAQAAAALAARPPPGTMNAAAGSPIPPPSRLEGMRTVLGELMSVFNKQEQQLATNQLLARHERDLEYQSKLNSLREKQRIRNGLVGSSQTRTANVARQLDMLEVLLLDLSQALDMFVRVIQPPEQTMTVPGLASPASPASPVGIIVG